MNGRRDQLPGSVLFDRREDGTSPVYLVIPDPVYVVHGPVTALNTSHNTNIISLLSVFGTQTLVCDTLCITLSIILFAI